MAHHSPQTPVRFQWTIKDGPEYSRSPLWYSMFAVFILTMVLVGLVTQSWLVSLVFLLLAGVYILVQLEDTKEVPVLISDVGIQLGSRFWSYGELEAFYVIYQPQVRNLYILPRSRVKAMVNIPLGDMEPSGISAYLSTQLPELAGMEEHLVDKIIRICKL